MKNKRSPSADTTKDYDKIIKAVNLLNQANAESKVSMYKSTFIKGSIAGLGGVIGATVGVAILLWGLSLLGEIPFIGEIANNVQSAIDSAK